MLLDYPDSFWTKGVSAWFQNNVSYCFTFGEDQTIYSALVMKKSVCMGISKAITLVLRLYGIDSIVVMGYCFRKASMPVQETKSGIVKVKKGARVKIILSSPDIAIEDNVEEQVWAGEYLTFNFAVMLPERQVLFMATVYIDDVIATRLKFIAKCWSLRQQKIKVTQEDVLSAFVSYASQDRNRVAMIVQGMQKARPDMEVVSITGIIFTREEETVVAQCSILVEMKVDSITVI